MAFFVSERDMTEFDLSLEFRNIDSTFFVFDFDFLLQNDFNALCTGDDGFNLVEKVGNLLNRLEELCRIGIQHLECTDLDTGRHAFETDVWNCDGDDEDDTGDLKQIHEGVEECKQPLRVEEGGIDILVLLFELLHLLFLSVIGLDDFDSLEVLREEGVHLRDGFLFLSVILLGFLSEEIGEEEDNRKIGEIEQSEVRNTFLRSDAEGSDDNDAKREECTEELRENVGKQSRKVLRIIGDSCDIASDLELS